MRKIIIFVMMFTFMFTQTSYAQSKESISIDTNQAEQGVVSVEYKGTTDKRLKVMVTLKGSTKKYFYNLYPNQLESFPLQLGNGQYQIAVLENTTGNKYKYLTSTMVKVTLKNELNVYLQSVQNIKWDPSLDSIKKAKELTKSAKTDEEKVKLIYNYITKNVEYDYDKISTLTLDYLPNVNSTFKSGKGICYDYSALFASMLRSLEIPTKMVKGYKDTIKGYHAWNEVFINGKWVVIDTTVDAEKKNPSMIKSAKEYKKVNEY